MTVLRDYAAGLVQPVLGAALDVPRYDEVVGPDGSLRTAWRTLGAVASGWGEQDLRQVDRDITRLLADDGVTYSRPGGATTPWRLDPVPLVIDAAAWSALAGGLAQRAEVLNALVVDLYGDQRVLAEGLVPAAVVHGHAGFLRAAVRPGGRDPRPLVLAATDLGRDAEGRWRVLGDRTQAPSGMGYAMENRRVIARVLPALYREADLHRVEPYFWALRSALIQAAEGDLGDPRVVVLSPGPGSETAFDQSFLASMLGFPLVQGSDLVVRGGWVMMRVAGRLERVDVILRRVDADFSDPLELRGDSRLGVPGLVEAVRRGRVRVVNGLGAGVLENPGLLPFLPAVCEALLGEELRLPAVPTWWCGDPAAWAEVAPRLGADGTGQEDRTTYVVRTLDGPRGELAGLDAEQLRARVEAAPWRHVVQQRLPLSSAPVWPSGRAGPLLGAQQRPVTLRAFTMRYGAAYRPLVGGLGSVVEEPDRDRPPGVTAGAAAVATPVAGAGASKDVWVLKASPGDPDQGLAEVLPVTSTRTLTGPSVRQLADLFWTGRYAERAEDLLRLIIAVHTLADHAAARPRSAGAVSLGVVLEAVDALSPRRRTELAELDGELRSLLLDGGRTGSVAQALDGLRTALQGVRDQLSADTWRAFGATDRATRALLSGEHSRLVGESAGRMLTGVLSLQGVFASMIRDPGWHLIGAGRALERTVQLVRLLRATTTARRGLDVDRELLSAVLVATESSVTHRRRYRGQMRLTGVLDLLLMDPENPRSLVFGLAELGRHLAALPSSTGSTRPERLIEDLTRVLAETDVASLSTIGGADRSHLALFLDEQLDALGRVGTAIEELHLASGPPPRALGELRTEVVATDGAGDGTGTA